MHGARQYTQLAKLRAEAAVSLGGFSQVESLDEENVFLLIGEIAALMCGIYIMINGEVILAVCL